MDMRMMVQVLAPGVEHSDETDLGADPKHLGAETGMIAILHTWGQNLHHHPHLHCIVPGGGLASDGRWIACRSGFFLPVHVLSRFYRRLFIERLQAAFDASRLTFFGDLSPLCDPLVFAGLLKLVRRLSWVVYTKRSFGGCSAGPRLSGPLYPSRGHRQRSSRRLP
jgi:hypothetical protein